MREKDSLVFHVSLELYPFYQVGEEELVRVILKACAKPGDV